MPISEDTAKTKITTDVPIVMMGFSLGSFILRDFLSRKHEHISQAVIAGTGTQPAFVLTLLKKLVKGETEKAGFDETTPLVKKLSFETYNRKIKPCKTTADRLCSDEKEVYLYLDDPLCSESISSGLFLQLLEEMEKTSGGETYKNRDKSMPVLLLSGSCDPVGNFRKGVEQIKKNMLHAGIGNIELKLIENSRHDIFHEYNSGGAKISIDALKNFLSRQIYNFPTRP